MNADSKTFTPDAEEQAAMVDAIMQMVPAPCGTRPKGGDDLSAPFTSDAVPAQQGGAQ